MKNYELYNIAEGIRKISDIVNIADINFTMIIARIDSEVNAEIRIIEKGRKKPSDKYKEYLKEKEALDMKYAIQKEDGSLQMYEGAMLIRDPKKYRSELSKLEETYKEEIKEWKKIVDEFEEFLEKDCPKVITKINKSLLPSSLNVEQVRLLYPVIDNV